MKMRSWIILVCIFLGMLYSCKYDNYNEPESFLTGNLIYEGEAINLGNGDVIIELWEDGWQTKNAIDVSVAQDGSYSANVFNSTYKLVIPSSQNPFQTIVNEITDSDTIIVEVNGDMHLDIEVLPYYLIQDVDFSVIARDVSVNFSINQILIEDSKSIEKVYLYINKGQFVDLQWNIADASMEAGSIEDLSSVTLTVTVPELTPAQDFVFGRIGLKINGVEKMIFSQVQRISF
ncbi:DUF3823 domain-containing protein [Carboxylicivirga caseinilyticus]|uniref:DUF3823 domain-containing protein n=1 Tax=Carboxylicivirga caseinilyticus TaxID=3417572 RepID=UPI003D34FB08|nr:DUF3823 domain-containing protein [Marinilabiliaceae bacterium A049]